MSEFIYSRMCRCIGIVSSLQTVRYELLSHGLHEAGFRIILWRGLGGLLSVLETRDLKSTHEESGIVDTTRVLN